MLKVSTKAIKNFSAYIIDHKGLHWLYDSSYDPEDYEDLIDPYFYGVLESHGYSPNLLAIQRDDDIVVLLWNGNEWSLLEDYSE